MRQIVGVLFLLAVISNTQDVRGADPFEALYASRISAKPAPNFSLPSIDGKKVSLSDYRGKVVLLGFFKTF